MRVQGREGLTVTPEACRWHRNWYVWCPVIITVAGAYSFDVTYQGAPLPSLPTDQYGLSNTRNPEYSDPTTDGFVHVNPGPAQRHLFTTDPSLSQAFPAGSNGRGIVHMWDALGNRAMPLLTYVGWNAQYFAANGLPFTTTSEGTYSFTELDFSTDVFQNTITKQDCSADCDASGNVTLSRDLATMGLIYFDYYFEVAGTYSLTVNHVGALSSVSTTTFRSRARHSLTVNHVGALSSVSTTTLRSRARHSLTCLLYTSPSPRD